jgi:hypothetical protein
VGDYDPKAVAHVLCDQCGRTAPPDAEHLIAKRLRRAYVEGVKDGIRRFAWQQDGTAFVGCGAKTLSQALADAEGDAVCRNCGNSGVGFDGLPCACRAAAGGPSGGR